MKYKLGAERLQSDSFINHVMSGNYLLTFLCILLSCLLEYNDKLAVPWTRSL